MSIKREEILHLAELSNISLSDQQIDDLTKDLENIIGYISQLDELDTEGVEPSYQCFDMVNVWRDDVIEKPEATNDEMLSLAKEIKEHQIKVPRVL